MSFNDRKYQLSVLEEQKRAQTSRGVRETGFSKDVKKILETGTAKYLFFGMIFLFIAVAITAMGLFIKEKDNYSDADKYRNISLIVGYTVLGITIGRSSYMYVNPNTPETAGTFIWYMMLWPFYIISAIYTFFKSNNTNDFRDMIKEFIGYSRLPPYPTGTEITLNWFRVVIRLSVLISLILIVKFLLDAAKGTLEHSEQHKDTTVMEVILIVLAFVLITPDSILDSKNWQYRAAILFSSVIFLYSYYTYLLGSYKDYEKDKKYAMGIVVAASGVLLFSICFYYFFYKLPNDERTRMLRGVFTDEQMLVINPILYRQIKLLENIVRQSAYFDENGYFNIRDEKLREEIFKDIGAGNAQRLDGKNKNSINLWIDELRDKFTTIYKAKEMYRIAMDRYLEKKDSSAMNDFINTPEFRTLETDEITKNDAIILKNEIIRAVSSNNIPDPKKVQDLFGIDNAVINTNEVELLPTTIDDFESKVEAVEEILRPAFNRAVFKALIQKYNEFMGKREEIGIESKDFAFNRITGENEIKIETIDDHSRAKINNIVNTIIRQSKKIETVGELKTICDQNMRKNKSDNKENFNKLFTHIKDMAPDNDDDKILKKLLGSHYNPPENNGLTIKERMDAKGITTADAAWKDDVIRQDIQNLGQNRIENAKKADKQNKEYYTALTKLIRQFAPAAAGDETNTQDLLKMKGVQENINILNKGIGEVRDFGKGNLEELLERAQLEANRYRNAIEQQFFTRKEGREQAEQARIDEIADLTKKTDLESRRRKVLNDFNVNWNKAVDEQLKEGKITKETKKALGIPEYVEGRLEILTEKEMREDLLRGLKNEINKERNKDKNPEEISKQFLIRTLGNYAVQESKGHLSEDFIVKQRQDELLKEHEERKKQIEDEKQKARDIRELEKLRAQNEEEKQKYNQKIVSYNRNAWGYLDDTPLIKNGQYLTIIAGKVDNTFNYYLLNDDSVIVVNKNTGKIQKGENRVYDPIFSKGDRTVTIDKDYFEYGMIQAPAIRKKSSITL